MCLYNQIKDAWAKANTNAALPDPALEAEARALEEQLSKRIEPRLAQFNDGMISASEFVSLVLHEASRPAE